MTHPVLDSDVAHRINLVPVEVRAKVHALKQLIDPAVDPFFGYGQDGSMLIVLRSREFAMRFLIRPDTSVNVAWEDQGGLFREAKKGDLEFAADVGIADIMRPLYGHIFEIAEDQATDRMAEEICAAEDVRIMAELTEEVRIMQRALRKSYNKRKKQARARTGRR